MALANLCKVCKDLELSRVLIQILPVAVLVFETTAAGTGVVAAHFGDGGLPDIPLHL